MLRNRLLVQPVFCTLGSTSTNNRRRSIQTLAKPASLLPFIKWPTVIPVVFEERLPYFTKKLLLSLNYSNFTQNTINFKLIFGLKSLCCRPFWSEVIANLNTDDIIMQLTTYC
jgi:hypothetical protein